MKRLFPLIALVALLSLGYPSAIGFASESTQTPTINAPSAIIIDMNTGGTLWQKDANERRANASTTKIMTAILTIERGNLDSTITVAKDSDLKRVFGLGLTPGEKLKLRDLLSALLLNSANDSAIALACATAGSTKDFVSMMNKKALSLGTKNTSFSNPHGLDAKNHYSSAYDLALIARYAMRNNTFASFASTKEARINRSNPKKISKVINRNKLLWNYNGVTGVKTGHTNKAGYCLVASAKRENVSLISVILGAKSQKEIFGQSAALLDYGFSLYEKKRLISKGKTYKTVKLSYGQRVELVAISNVSTFVKRSTTTTTRIVGKRGIKVPIKEGEVLGKIIILQSDKPVATSQLVARKNVEKPNLIFVMGYYFNKLLAFF